MNEDNSRDITSQIHFSRNLGITSFPSQGDVVVVLYHIHCVASYCIVLHPVALCRTSFSFVLSLNYAVLLNTALLRCAVTFLLYCCVVLCCNFLCSVVL